MFSRLHHWLDWVTGTFTRSAALLGSMAEVLEPEGTRVNKCRVSSVTRLWGLLGQEDPVLGQGWAQASFTGETEVC